MYFVQLLSLGYWFIISRGVNETFYNSRRRPSLNGTRIHLLPKLNTLILQLSLPKPVYQLLRDSENRLIVCSSICIRNTLADSFHLSADALFLIPTLCQPVTTNRIEIKPSCLLARAGVQLSRAAAVLCPHWLLGTRNTLTIGNTFDTIPVAASASPCTASLSGVLRS